METGKTAYSCGLLDALNILVDVKTSMYNFWKVEELLENMTNAAMGASSAVFHDISVPYVSHDI